MKDYCIIGMTELNLEGIQQQSLEVLKAFDAYAREHDIKYFLAYGTLLGAARHKGFITWDDDIDVLVPRPDYDRLCREFKADGYEIIYPGNTPSCYLPFGRLCDTRRTLVKSADPWIKGRTDYGIWIDLFPLDSVTDNQEEFTALYRDMLKYYKEQLSIRRRKTMIDSAFGFKRNLKTVLHWFLHPVRHFQNPIPVRDKVLKAMADCPPYGSTGHLSMLPCPEREWEWFPAEDFARTVMIDFCGLKFPAPAAYDRHLRQVFGDYMQLPPEEERTPRQMKFMKFYLRD